MHFHVVAEHYKASGPIELTVSKNVLSLSGEGFTISDAEGNVAFKMDGHTLSLRDRCTLLDHNNHPILTARKKVKLLHFTLNPSQVPTTKQMPKIHTYKF